MKMPKTIRVCLLQTGVILSTCAAAMAEEGNKPTVMDKTQHTFSDQLNFHHYNRTSSQLLTHAIPTVYPDSQRLTDTVHLLSKESSATNRTLNLDLLGNSVNISAASLSSCIAKSMILTFSGNKINLAYIYRRNGSVYGGMSNGTCKLVLSAPKGKLSPSVANSIVTYRYIIIFEAGRANQCQSVQPRDRDCYCLMQL